MLRNKKILLGVCGSIAAYKAAFLIRLLVKAGADVRVISTTSASDFISPLTLSTLSKNPVLTKFVKNEEGEWNNHVELGLWADLMLIAPLSANTLGKMANGICDNLLLATYLSAKCPVMVAPAMDLDMHAHPSTQKNLNIIRSFGNMVIDAEDGELASGLSGQGRMAEPENIIQFLESYFTKSQVLAGKKILITAGPTYEAIDPVRFIGNHSTGKMGYALAKTCLMLGAEVVLISGPSNESISENPALQLIKVQSAQEMLVAAEENFAKVDIGIMSAAVADYAPKNVADKKIKKSEDTLTIELIRNPDIAKTLGAKKRKNQLLIGFALETDNEEVNAKRKLEAKNFDLIILNSLQDEGAGFAHNTNKVTLITSKDSLSLPLLSKDETANKIIDYVVDLLNQKAGN
ncbi:bifunctional phosphopantothenoylcysteine decarboxylase/phosphopantothenate--cysteine ligase CoaBC [Fulvivirgaceae bacterium LMO-SS25]